MVRGCGPCHDGCDTHHLSLHLYLYRIVQPIIRNARQCSTSTYLYTYVVECGTISMQEYARLWPWKSAMSENRSDHGWSGCYGLEAYNYTHKNTHTQRLQIHTHTNYNHKISTYTTTLTWTTTTQGHILYMQQRNASLYNIMTESNKILCYII